MTEVIDLPAIEFCLKCTATYSKGKLQVIEIGSDIGTTGISIVAQLLTPPLAARHRLHNILESALQRPSTSPQLW